MSDAVGIKFVHMAGVCHGYGSDGKVDEPAPMNAKRRVSAMNAAPKKFAIAPRRYFFGSEP
jgi:hypothetical protein